LVINLNQKKNLEKIGEALLILHDLTRSEGIRLLSTGNIINLATLNDSKIINRVYQYVVENFHEKIELSTAADIAHMQKAAFCRYFKRKTKKRFMEVVNETRIVHAQKLLAETDKSALEIAFECGYESSSYFYRQFKLFSKLSPLAYRNQIKETSDLNRGPDTLKTELQT